jgi:hypothetical protein
MHEGMGALRIEVPQQIAETRFILLWKTRETSFRKSEILVGTIRELQACTTHSGMKPSIRS